MLPPEPELVVVDVVPVEPEPEPEPEVLAVVLVVPVEPLPLPLEVVTPVEPLPLELVVVAVVAVVEPEPEPLVVVALVLPEPEALVPVEPDEPAPLPLEDEPLLALVEPELPPVVVLPEPLPLEDEPLLAPVLELDPPVVDPLLPLVAVLPLEPLPVEPLLADALVEPLLALVPVLPELVLEVVEPPEEALVLALEPEVLPLEALVLPEPDALVPLVLPAVVPAAVWPVLLELPPFAALPPQPTAASRPTSSVQRAFEDIVPLPRRRLLRSINPASIGRNGCNHRIVQKDSEAPDSGHLHAQMSGLRHRAVRQGADEFAACSNRGVGTFRLGRFQMRALTKWLAVVGMVAGPAGLAFADAGGTHAIDVDSAYTATPTPDAACGGFHVVGVGTAWGDPVGATGTWADAECANLLVDPGYFVIDGTITLTTSHGELLVLNYHVVSGPPDLNFDIHPQGTFTVDGARSTGPYAGATGSGTVTAVANLVTGAATAHVQGSYTHVDGS